MNPSIADRIISLLIQCFGAEYNNGKLARIATQTPARAAWPVALIDEEDKPAWNKMMAMGWFVRKWVGTRSKRTRMMVLQPTCRTLGLAREFTRQRLNLLEFVNSFKTME